MSHCLVTLCLFVGLLIALLFRLDSVPPIWWDEGWTFTVARNWVELGHYGRLENGEFVSRGLEASFPVTASVALSIQLFGAGVYQARLMAVVFTLAALALSQKLASALYDRRVAIATLGAVILLSSTADIQPLLAGRQVLGEMPALAFLLAGYLCFVRLDERPFVYIPLVVCCWALALFTKVQVQPFWLLSLVVPLLLCMLRRKWRQSVWIAVCLCGSLALYLAMQSAFAEWVESARVSGLTQVIALALDKHTRWVVLGEILRYGVPTLLGLGWAAYSIFKIPDKVQSQREVTRVAFFVLVGSWFTWYALLSLGWPRYMLPPAFLGSIFVASMLSDWTKRFNLAFTIQQAGSALRTLRFRFDKLGALASVILVAVSLGQTLKVFYGAYVEADDSYEKVVRFLNNDTPPRALIETYESELFFLLKRRYHYPPDQVHVELIRRNSLGHHVKIDYDPLAFNPDYLVVGPQSKFWDFYEPYLKTGAFRLLHDYSRYQIYERASGDRLSPRNQSWLPR